MGLEQTTIREIVEKAVQHRWGVPEFQRGFVWRPQKVRDLIDSLWRTYPVGSFLLWYGAGPVEPRIAADQKQPDGWLVDGQQRTTALCILLGRKPYWWHSDDCFGSLPTTESQRSYRRRAGVRQARP